MCYLQAVPSAMSQLDLSGTCAPRKSSGQSSGNYKAGPALHAVQVVLLV